MRFRSPPSAHRVTDDDPIAEEMSNDVLVYPFLDEVVAKEGDPFPVVVGRTEKGGFGHVTTSSKVIQILSGKPCGNPFLRAICRIGLTGDKQNPGLPGLLGTGDLGLVGELDQPPVPVKRGIAVPERP
jgi:hypothetical protein